MMADAFLSMVSSAAIALSCTSGEPDDITHEETSSIAEARACWLCSNNVRTSAMAILEWLFGMTVFLDGDAEIVAQTLQDDAVVEPVVRLKFRSPSLQVNRVRESVRRWC